MPSKKRDNRTHQYYIIHLNKRNIIHSNAKKSRNIIILGGVFKMRYEMVRSVDFGYGFSFGHMENRKLYAHFA